MSLYNLQKLFYRLNREPELVARYKADSHSVIGLYDLTEEESGAIEAKDVGLLYVLGVNGQLLMHFAALCGLPWPDYIQSMRTGVQTHGPVRAGVYAMTTTKDQKVAGV